MVQTVSIIEEERRVEIEIRDIRRKIETESWQRCRPFILRDGDKNTSYFHYCASHRRKQNRIKSLFDSNGVEKVEQSEIMNVVCAYILIFLHRLALPFLLIKLITLMFDYLMICVLLFLSR